MVAERHHGDVRGRAREDPDAPQGTLQLPLTVPGGFGVGTGTKSFSGKLPLPLHPACFPHPQAQILTPRPQEPAPPKVARGRKRKYVISCATRRNPGWKEKNCLETMATFFLAPADGFSMPSTPIPPARTLHLIFVALNSPKTGSSFSHLSVSEGQRDSLPLILSNL